MPEFLRDYRAKNPAYDDLEDNQLLAALHGQYIDETGADLSLDQFRTSVGYGPIQPEIIEPVGQQPLTEDEFNQQLGSAASGMPGDVSNINEQIQAAYDQGASQEQIIELTDSLQQPVAQPIAQPIEQGPSMLDLVGSKLESLGAAVVSGAEGAIPQAKLQLSGLLQSGEFITEQEFKGRELTKRDGTPQTYQEAKADFEALNPFRTWVAKKGRELSEGVRVDLKPPTAEKGTPEYYAEAITGSIINMLPMLGVSIIGRRPDIGLGIMLAQSKGGAYEQGRLEGLGTLEAETYSSLTSAAEIIPSILPLGVLMKPSGKFVTDLVKAGVSEAAQETVTAALQAGIDKGYIDEDMTWGEAVDRMIEGAIVGAGAGVTISATTSKLVEKMAEKDQIKAVEDEISFNFDESMAGLPTAEEEAVELLKPERGEFQEEKPKKTAREILAEQDQSGLPLAEDLQPEQVPTGKEKEVIPEDVPHGTVEEPVVSADIITDSADRFKKSKVKQLSEKLDVLIHSRVLEGVDQSEDIPGTPSKFETYLNTVFEPKMEVFREIADKEDLTQSELLERFETEIIEEIGSKEKLNKLIEAVTETGDPSQILEGIPKLGLVQPLSEKPIAKEPALTPMPENIHLGPATYKPKPISGDLFRESNIESLSDLLRDSLSNNVEQGSVTPLFVTDNKDIALGQGVNKGIMIELDGSLVSGRKVKKPGIIEGITGLEYKTDFVGRDAIKSFTIPKGQRISGAGRVLAKGHFDITKNDDGSTTYTRKDLVEKITEADVKGEGVEVTDEELKIEPAPVKEKDILFSVQVGTSKPVETTETTAKAKPAKLEQAKGDIYQAPGTNYIGMHRSMGIPERRQSVTIEGRTLKIPDKPQRIEPIMRKLVQIAGRRIYFGKIKNRSAEGFYRPHIGEIRTRRKNDVEVLAHELAHYLDLYSNEALPNFEALYKRREFVDQVKALSYTDAGMGLQEIEGFAEFVRLWLTNSQEAATRAPEFYNEFNNLLATDRKLLNPMRDMQDLMHKFYFQGPDKLGQALIGRENTFIEDFDQWKYRRDSRIRQQTIDRFHAARKIEQELTYKIGNANESAWKQFRIANGGAEGIADYIMNYGTVNFDADGNLERSGKSLHDVLKPVKSIKLIPEHKGDKKIDLLTRYFAGRRAIELHKQGRENLIPIETAKVWARLGGTYPVFETIHKDYQAFNKRMMNMFHDSGLVTSEGRRAMESMNKDYVPFNRIRDTLTGQRGPGSGGFQRLKGGTANLNDILVNIQDGIVSNVRAALTNKAKQRLYQYVSNNKDGAIFATHIAPDSKKVQVYLEEMENKIGQILDASGIEVDGEIDLTDPELTSFWQHGIKPKVNESGNLIDTVIINGKPKYYEVQDPLLQDMLLAMNPESYGSIMNIMFAAKNIFTGSITLGIQFMQANIVRDTIGATFLSKNNFTPFLDSFKGMYSFFRKDKDFQAFLRSGGGYSSRFMAATSEGKARRRVRVEEFGVMSLPERLLSGIDNIASSFEYGTRIGEFKLTKKAGKSDLDAGFASREISTDFSVLGANRFLTGWIRTVPFLNAMIQSQDRIFREAIVKRKYDGNPTGLAMKAFLGITIPTLALYLINKDDDDYKDIPEYEKRTNWHLPNGDGSFTKVPRPYDVGFVYATMPELFYKYLEDENGREFADGMIWTLTQMYGIDGTPALMTGWWDLVRNKKWTGAPVVPQALADVEATEQYNSNTSETFIRLGEVLGVSPIKAEHVFKAYTGYLGGYLMLGTDHLLWDKEKFGDNPNSQPSDNVFLSRFVPPKVRPYTATMEKFFVLKEQSDKVVATFKQTVDARRAIKQREGAGKFKDDRFFGLSGEEKAVLFSLNDSMNELIKVMYGKSGIKTAELKIKHDKNLSGKEKREQIDDLWRARNKGFMQYYTAANKALQKAKKESEQEK